MKNKKYKVSLEDIKDRLSKYEKYRKEIEELEFNDKFLYLIDLIYREYREDITNLLLKGYTSEEVTELTRKAMEGKNFKRDYIQKVFDLLRKNNIEIYICSASVVEEVYFAADFYGIKRENVMAINIQKDENGILTGEEYGIKTRAEGKVEAIKKLNYNYPPVIVAGDTDGDYYMMKDFDILHAMIINPKDGSKIKSLVDGEVFCEYKI